MMLVSILKPYVAVKPGLVVRSRTNFTTHKI